MKLLINGKSRKIMYNEKDKYYYKCKDGKVDANQYFLKGDKVGSLTEGSLKKQCRKMLVGGSGSGSGSGSDSGSGSGSDKDFEAEDEDEAKELKAKELEAKEKDEAYNQIVQFQKKFDSNNNNNNNNDNNNNKCDDDIQEILNEYFDTFTDENTRKEKAINTVKILTTKITSALCENNYNNDWTKKKAETLLKKT